MPENTTHILVVEDHADIAEILAFHLTKEGFQVSVASDGDEALKKIQAHRPDLILLDWMLPKLNGLEVARTVRAKKEWNDTFIIMLTAKGSEQDIVLGLETGADDYVVKPVKPKELIARIRAMLRRRPAALMSPEKVSTIGSLVIDENRHLVSLDGVSLEFTLTEFQLLAALTGSTGRIFTRDQLIDKVRGHHVSIVDRNIDVHISSIRKKLKGYGKRILTVRGVGYRFLEA